MMTPEQRVAGLPPEMVQRVYAIAQAMQSGQMDAAERVAIATLAKAPRHPELLRLVGMLQEYRGRSEQAVDTLLLARAQRPDDPMIYNSLGSAYGSLKDYKRARDALRRACELGPELTVCWFNYARRLLMDGDSEAAIEPLQRVLALQPTHPNARAMLANLLRADGETINAAAEFRRIIADNPATAGQAWWGLATLKPMPLNDTDIEIMRGVLQDDTAKDNDRIYIGFALAVALEAKEDFAGAFSTMQSAHAIAARTETYVAQRHADNVRVIVEAFTPPPQSAIPAQGEEVIFIVSLPRSGSTLTEQILASHSQVEGGTELPDLSQVIMDECDRVRQTYHQWVKTHSPQQWHALGQEYLRRTQRWRERRPRFTDKSPGNWQHVGAILAMLPNARVVVCRRDPLETCLACYRYIFVRHPFTHDLNDLASHWHTFDRTVRQWKQLYPDRIREQVYEDLVADPETQIRELLEFCNLP
ncbi:MAG TPA: sulfotransferase, partial [Rudaea sp.]|nr:sulfotransferase [Rudaea sp.]